MAFNPVKLGAVLAGSALVSVLVGEFVTAANLTGSAGTIAGLFTFILVGSAGMFAVSKMG